MNSQQQPQKITLEDIVLRKEAVLKKIRIQKEVMTDTAREIFAPLAPAVSTGSKIQRAFNTGMAVFDGVMLGVKLMRKLRGFFRR